MGVYSTLTQLQNAANQNTNYVLGTAGGQDMTNVYGTTGNTQPGVAPPPNTATAPAAPGTVGADGVTVNNIYDRGGGWSQGMSQSLGESQSTGMSLSQASSDSVGASTSVGTGKSTSKQDTRIVGGMLDVYNDLLKKNQANYQNVLDAYGKGAAVLSGGIPGLTGGYDELSQSVAGTLGQGGGWGVAAPAAQAIADAYAQARGATTQQLTNAGLGNTTVVGNMQNQNASAASRAYADLGAQLADKYAGYQSNIGLTGLEARRALLGTESGYYQGALGALGQQFGNTAGSLTGSYGTSESEQESRANSMNTSNSRQMSQSNQQSTSQNQSLSQNESRWWGGGQAGSYPTSGSFDSNLPENGPAAAPEPGTRNVAGQVWNGMEWVSPDDFDVVGAY